MQTFQGWRFFGLFLIFFFYKYFKSPTSTLTKKNEKNTRTNETRRESEHGILQRKLKGFSFWLFKYM